ncbi:MAG: toll/interleukin-1 receptor domain-containing protein, partial [Chlorobiaceae bacterium]|nr:toll/interleukin-1 receptor domain-containing protein [Chlorobiaceae bacterium]
MVISIWKEGGWLHVSSLLRIFNEKFAYRKNTGISDIFVSYAHEDKERVRPIVDQLERRGWSLFWDDRIFAGERWDKVIGENLEYSRCVVVVWSQVSITKEWVSEEAMRVKEKNILVPVRIDKVEPPIGFGLRQYIDLSDWNDDPSTPQFKKFVGDIDHIAPLQASVIGTSDVAEIISLLENPKRTEAALDRVAREMTFKGGDRELFERKRKDYSPGMREEEKKRWIDDMIKFLT